MNEARKKMNLELYSIAAYRSAIFTRRIMIFMLGILFTYGLNYKIYSQPIIYIILVSFLLPEAINMVFSYFSKQEFTPQFQRLWKLYHCSPQKARNHILALFFDIIFLLLWQNTSAPEFPHSFFTYLPTFLALFVFLSLVLGIPIACFIYQHKMIYGKL